MTDVTSLENRLKAESLEIIDFAPIFVRWVQQKFPNIDHVWMLKFARPFTARTVFGAVGVGVLATTALLLFMVLVQEEPYSVSRHALLTSFSVGAVLALHWGGNWAARKMATAHGRELMMQVLPKGRYVDPEMRTRIKRVSHWFEPVGQFVSDVPSMSGILIGVLSPVEPKLFFVREIQRQAEGNE